MAVHRHDGQNTGDWQLGGARPVECGEGPANPSGGVVVRYTCSYLLQAQSRYVGNHASRTEVDSMAKTASTPTRVSADVFEAAAAVGRLEHRTATEQVNYWARIGMQIERSGTLAHRKVLDVAAGRSQFSELSDHDRQVAHALVDAAIAERVATAQFGPSARADGKRTVSIDEDGMLIEIGPDGAVRPL